MTPQQQASLRHLLETAQLQFLSLYRQYGVIGLAADKAGINRDTVSAWRNSSPEFSQAMQDADADLADELAALGIKELRMAEPGAILLHPNLYFHEMQYREPGRRQNATAAIAVQVNVSIEDFRAARAKYQGSVIDAGDTDNVTVDVTSADSEHESA